MPRMLVTVLMLFAFVAGAATIGGTTMRTDPVLPASLAKEINELKRRIAALERSNPLQQASAHDGNTTRLQVGRISHPFSNPIGADDFGLIVRAEDGTPVFMLDSGGPLIPGQTGFIQNGDSSGASAHTHSSGAWTDAQWPLYFVGLTSQVMTVSLAIRCAPGVTTAQARLLTSGIGSGDKNSNPITLNCTGNYENYQWHWNNGGDLDPNDIWIINIETRVTGGAGDINVYQPRFAISRSAVAVDTNVTG